ncbi:MAG: hypothetical protein PVJ66_10205 [Gammaproteobacteria bacterium]|jgi:hypothetical protein
MPGKHADDFEVKFSADEITKARDLHWSVRKISARFDFAKSRDADLDCSRLSC